ncbi:hypothetical protein GJ698_12625 [Pseudoduganella sp. FT26W]|uniref:DUF2987 domain-containing protein n=2 Tax=Duganella aquatilis TaxID=2666082 RepID=A0A844D524_9BURK|nr:hypothetical protein [Duganella aquatilis]
MLLLLLSMWWQPAMAAEPDDDPGPMVIVNGTRSPELQPYRYMLSGLDAFDDYHELAPKATEVRFRMTRRDKAPADALNELAVRLSGNQTDIALPLDAEHSFLLPRNEQAEDENADVVLNKKKSNYGFMPLVRSPGVPEGMRRLGDIRLECRVLVAVGKNYIPFLVRAMINTLTLSTDWCGYKDFKMGVKSDVAIAGATLVDGDLRVPLKVGKDGKSYTAPIGDKHYSNDALIEVELM